MTYQQHMEYLCKEHEIELNDKARLCYKLAYDYGHHAGYKEVENYFSELVELIK